jgi:CubicO group peptidase (beta-lactamase class C family)
MVDQGSAPKRLPGTAPDNWLDPPFSSWALWHLDELVLCARVPRGTGRVRPLPAHPAPPALDQVWLTRTDGGESSVEDLLGSTHTDAFAALHDGRLVAERYRYAGAEHGLHGMLSITKSVVGCVAGVLVDRGDLDVTRRVEEYLPELAESGYRGATVRHLLDMRSGVRFVEDYIDPDSDISRLERALGNDGLAAFLATLRREREHGGHFLYRSAETDVLGWVCERASDTPMAELISTLVWAPIGAEHDAVISTDVNGMAVSDGGLAASAKDLLRFGQMLLELGTVAWDGVRRQVVPARWVRDAWAVGSDIRSAFLDSPNETSMPGGWYRNQFWFRPGPSGDVLLCIGIHGQLLYVCRRTRTVCVKLSSWPTPQNPRHLQDTLRACDALSSRLGGAAASQGASRGVAGVAAGLSRVPRSSRAPRQLPS